MDLQPKTYLIIYALIVTPIVISFFFLRKRQAPSKLNLTGSEEHKKLNDPQGRKPVAQGEYPRPRTPQVVPEVPVEKALNVFFQWNGHAWDAYEALGLPAGSSLDSVKAAYQKLQVSGDKQSLPFFKAAYEAVLRHYSQP